MSVNNKQRRAAKAKQRAKARTHSGASADWDWQAAQHEARRAFRFALVGLLGTLAEDPRPAAGNAAALLGGKGHAARLDVVRETLSIAEEVLASVVRFGWSPADLAEILYRRAGGGHGSTLHALLDAHARRFDPALVPAPWRSELDALPPAARAFEPDVDSLAGLLTVAGVLSDLPRIVALIDPPGAASRAARTVAADPAADPADAKQLARVRALLAKAESTQYQAEAEALTAKAQELISRHALARLLERGETGSPADSVVVRRVWIDAPYVTAKAMLLSAVAKANRCRAVLSENLGLLTVVGEACDLNVVDLLGTSLLVQANAAMLRHGSQIDRSGGSRTRSFRQSFLISYANRIGERLHQTDVAAVADSGERERLLPVLRAAEQAVDERVARLFPKMSSAAARASNGHGWAAGRAAADLASLDVHGRLTAAG